MEKREIAALERAVAKFPRAPAPRLLLVAHEKGTHTAPGGIHIVDAWRYLLDSPSLETRCRRAVSVVNAFPFARWPMAGLQRFSAFTGVFHEVRLILN